MALSKEEELLQKEAIEYIEGRNILKDKFIEQFFSSQSNTSRIKQEFGDKIILNCVLKNSQNNVDLIEFNCLDLRKFLKTCSSKGAIKEYATIDLLNLLN